MTSPNQPIPKPESIPLCIPEIAGNEWQYLKECLDTGWVSSAGPFVDRFEKEMAAYLGVRYAVALLNGTAALHMALLVAGVEPGDEVLVSDLTFIAPVNAIRYVGAFPVLVAPESRYWQIDPDSVCTFLEKECQWKNGALYNRTTDRRVRALLPVHILGHPVAIDTIVEAGRKFDLTVIEDATEGLGALFHGRPVGSLTDVSCLSFNGNKLITSGGGGMLVTNRKDWAEKARYLSTQAKDDPVEFVHKEVGFNYRLTNLQAAVGCAQLEHIEQHIERKRAIATRYTEALKKVVGLTPMGEAAEAFSTFWMYTILINEEEYGLSSRQLLEKLSARGIQTRPLWAPMHQNPAHAGSIHYGCGVSDTLYGQSLCLPCSVGLTNVQQETVIQAVRSFSQG